MSRLAMSEAEWQQQVIDLSRTGRWTPGLDHCPRGCQ